MFKQNKNNITMAKDFIPLSIRIKESTEALKNIGYVVINTNDENFAILAERKRILCKGHIDFFKKAEKLINEK